MHVDDSHDDEVIEKNSYNSSNQKESTLCNT